jgi:hypothetical protein
MTHSSCHLNGPLFSSPRRHLLQKTHHRYNENDEGDVDGNNNTCLVVVFSCDLFFWEPYTHKFRSVATIGWMDGWMDGWDGYKVLSVASPPIAIDGSGHFEKINKSQPQFPLQYCWCHYWNVILPTVKKSTTNHNHSSTTAAATWDTWGWGRQSVSPNCSGCPFFLVNLLAAASTTNFYTTTVTQKSQSSSYGDSLLSSLGNSSIDVFYILCTRQHTHTHTTWSSIVTFLGNGQTDGTFWVSSQRHQST